MMLGLGAPAQALPAEGGFPLTGLFNLMSAARAFASGNPATPKQGRGNQPDRGNYVAQAFVADNDKTKRAKNELARFAPHRPDAATRTANPSGKGFDYATSTRVASAATDRSDVYANTDGTFTRRVYSNPVNYKAADGSWKPINSKLRRGSDGRVGEPRLVHRHLQRLPAVHGSQLVAHAVGQRTGSGLVGLRVLQERDRHPRRHGTVGVDELQPAVGVQLGRQTRQLQREHVHGRHLGRAEDEGLLRSTGHRAERQINVREDLGVGRDFAIHRRGGFLGTGQRVRDLLAGRR
jgi:hypothetical protein